MSAETSRTSVVAAPVEAVWDLLADFGALARWVPEVDHSCLLRRGPVGVGTTRRVQVERTTLLETVDAWSPPEHLGYTIAGLPPALRDVRNDWHLRPVADGTEVAVTTAVDAGARPPQRLLAALVARRMAATSGHMLAGLAAALTSGDRTRA